MLNTKDGIFRLRSSLSELLFFLFFFPVIYHKFWWYHQVWWYHMKFYELDLFVSFHLFRLEMPLASKVVVFPPKTNQNKPHAGKTVNNWNSVSERLIVWQPELAVQWKDPYWNGKKAKSLSEMLYSVCKYRSFEYKHDILGRDKLSCVTYEQWVFLLPVLERLFLTFKTRFSYF